MHLLHFAHRPQREANNVRTKAGLHSNFLKLSVHTTFSREGHSKLDVECELGRLRFLANVTVHGRVGRRIKLCALINMNNNWFEWSWGPSMEKLFSSFISSSSSFAAFSTFSFHIYSLAFLDNRIIAWFVCYLFIFVLLQSVSSSFFLNAFAIFFRFVFYSVSCLR